jgi:NTE family protein
LTPDLARLAQGGGLRVLARLFGGLRRPHLAEAKRAEEGLKALFGDALLEESPIPLAIQAADLLTGEAVVLRRGPVFKAVLASMAIPGLFPPVAWEGRLLVDGDVAEKVPVRAARAPLPQGGGRGRVQTRRPRSRPGRPSRPPSWRGRPAAAASKSRPSRRPTWSSP